MENDLGSKFENIKQTIKLSKKEKDFHRAEIIKLMGNKPSPYFNKTINSPFYTLLSLRRHLVATSLVVVLISSTGLGVTSANSLPNNSLYSIKTNILEPISIFLTTNSKAKAKLRVALVERRMQEFSQVSMIEDLSLENKTHFIEKLSSQIVDAHEGISELLEDEDFSGATEVTNDLQSILSAQDTILDAVDEENPENSGISEVASVIDDSIQATNVIEDNITDEVQTLSDETELDVTINNQKERINETLENLAAAKEQDISEDKENIEIITQEYIDLKISQIKASLEEADKKLAAGDKDGTLEIYNQIDQDLGEIESLIHAEQKLKIEDAEGNEESGDNKKDATSVDLES